MLAALVGLVGAAAGSLVTYLTVRHTKKSDDAAARIKQQWDIAMWASDLVVSQDEASRRLGAQHLAALRDAWSTDKAVRAFVWRSLQTAIAPVVARVEQAQAVAQLSGTPSPSVAPIPGVPSNVGGGA